MSTLYTITESRDGGTVTPTIKGSTTVLVLTDGSRRTSDGTVPVYLLDKRATVETTLASILDGSSGIEDSVLSYSTWYTVEEGDDETDGHDIAVPFVVLH